MSEFVKHLINEDSVYVKKKKKVYEGMHIYICMHAFICLGFHVLFKMFPTLLPTLFQDLVK